MCKIHNSVVFFFFYFLVVWQDNLFTRITTDFKMHVIKDFIGSKVELGLWIFHLLRVSYTFYFIYFIIFLLLKNNVKFQMGVIQWCDWSPREFTKMDFKISASWKFSDMYHSAGKARRSNANHWYPAKVRQHKRVRW